MNLRSYPLIVLSMLVMVACGGSASPPATGGSGGIPQGGTGGTGGGGGVKCPDSDGDGFIDQTCGGDDCNDGDPTIYPGAPEICRDGIAQNCNAPADEGCNCSVGDMQPCWDGNAAQRGMGQCSDGYQRCDVRGVWGTCTGEVKPSVEPLTCDGIDQDCDGKDVSGCDGCLDHEICGNGLDDDCNGTIDDNTLCNVSCLPSATPLPDELACCSDGARFSYLCVEASELAACTDTGRACMDLDGDASTRCVKRCSADGTCVCGRPADPVPTSVADCGFETPCNRLGCEGRIGASCYSGRPATLGVGRCHGGSTTCTDGAWGSCTGEVLPVVEVCGNAIDDDCDGIIDENDGMTGLACPRRTDCADKESCDNGFDDDCDGFVDEGCLASDDEQACFSGPASGRNQGTCKAGVQKKQPDGYWGPCVGEVLPAPERCGDGLDTDCNGVGGPHEPEEASCCKATGDETCNGKDDDCDGLVDEGLLTSCGTCDASCPDSFHVDSVTDCMAPGRACSRLKAAEGGGLQVNVDASQDRAGDRGLYFYTSNGLRRFDTASQKTDWDLADYTTTSYQTLGAAVDGSVWIADVSRSLISHIDVRGQKICDYAQVLPATYYSAPAVDEEGTAWIMLQDPATLAFSLIHFENDAVQAGTCVPTGDPLKLEGTTLYQPVVGPPPLLWITGDPSGLRIDRTTLVQKRITMSTGYFAHPVVTDAGDLWVFSSTLSTLLHVAPDDDGSHAETFSTTIYQLYDVAGGKLWGLDYPSYALGSFDLATHVTADVTLPPDVGFISDVVADGQGLLWMTQVSTDFTTYQLASYSPAGHAWTSFADQVPMSHFDSLSSRTSAAQQRWVRFRGAWSQDLDGGSNTVIWTSATWTADVPATSTLRVSFRVADRPDLLTKQRACGPFIGGTADLSTCLSGSPRGRFMRVTVDLSASMKSTPVFKDIAVNFGRP